ncbi:MAG: HD domain-containing protein [Nitrospirae bacterium]|nr:HD domain-containing protein [Nitrospirota bacterium]
MFNRIKKHILFLSISPLGFIFLFVYLYSDYIDYGKNIYALINHLKTTYFPPLIIHIIVFTAPILSTTIGFLFERVLVYKRTLEKKVDERTASLKATEKRLRELSEHLEQEVLERTERLQKSIRYWTNTFDATPYGILIIDKDFNILRLNRYITELLGKDYDEIKDKKCYEIFHGSDSPVRECPLGASLLSGKSEGAEFYEPSLKRYLWISVSPILQDGKADTFVHSIVDITGIKEKEREIEKSRDAFLNMLRDIHESYEELKDLFLSVIRAFVHTLDAKSRWTKGHSERVTMYAVQIAEEMGMNKDVIEDLRIAALLHDIGKIGTYDYLLDKPERLNEDEFKIVQRHPATAVEILLDIKQFKNILPIIRHHHERFDGKGYPDGLKGEEIPFGARILCVADSFDSMTADRPYRPSPGIEYAKLELRRCAGTQFDPNVVKAFLKILGGDQSGVSEP